MIPKKIHLQWFFDEVPVFADYVIQKYREMMPDYDVVFWRSLPEDLPEEIANFCNDSRIATACRADILRYWTLYRHGGFYADMDSLPLRSFDSLVNLGFLCCRANGIPNARTDCGKGWIDCCLLGSEPGHEFWTVVFDKCRHHEQWRQANAWFAPVNTFPRELFNQYGVTVLDNAIQEVKPKEALDFFEDFQSVSVGGLGYIRHFRLTDVLSRKMNTENHWKCKTWNDIYGG